MDFSKVKSLSIPQGKVKDVSVAGVKVWKESTADEPTYTVSGVWVFYDMPYFDYLSDAVANVNFTSNGVSFTKMTAKMGYGLYYEDSRVYSPPDWLNNAYKTVDFGLEEQSVSEKFYTWLTANATQTQFVVKGAYFIDKPTYFQSYPFSETINFKSNGKTFIRMQKSNGYYENDPNDYHKTWLHYTDTNDNRIQVFATAGGWSDNDYRVVDFYEGKAVSKDNFLTFIQTLEPVITFYVDGILLYAKKGMTWGEWLNSDLSTVGLVSASEYEGLIYFTFDHYDTVLSLSLTDKIIEGHDYV